MRLRSFLLAVATLAFTGSSAVAGTRAWTSDDILSCMATSDTRGFVRAGAKGSLGGAV